MEEKYVKFYYGVMGSGKTLDLLIAAYNKEKAGKKLLLLNQLLIPKQEIKFKQDLVRLKDQ